MRERYEVFYQGQSVGEVTLSQQGVYTLLSCTCGKVTGQITRLLCQNGQQTASVGVMMPEGTRLVLGKRLTRSDLTRLGLTPESTFLLSEGQRRETGAQTDPDPAPAEGMWAPCREPGTVFADPELQSACAGVRGALTRKQGDETLLAVPLGPDRPFPMMPVFCFGTCERIGGSTYLVIKKKNGKLIV